MADECAHSRDSLERLGFTGFVTFSELRSFGFEQVPTEGGVYIVLREDQTDPKFLATSSGGRFKGREPSVGLDVLESRWVTGCQIVYMGKADKSGTHRHLRKRLQEFANFGSGKAVGHWGGRFIWQLKDASELVVCWKTDEQPRALEIQLIAAFEASHGTLPFANLSH